MFDLYKKILKDEISEEELFYLKLKQENENIIDFSLKMKRNKEKYPSLITMKDDITNNTLYCVNSFSNIIFTKSLKNINKENMTQYIEITINTITIFLKIEDTTLMLSQYICYFLDKEEAEHAFEHYIKKK